MSHRLLITLLSSVMVLAACSSAPESNPRAPKLVADKDDSEEDAKDDEEPTDSTRTQNTPPPATPSEPPAEPPPVTPPAATFPRPANAGECALGDGLYCSGNGVDGAVATLYRCTNGTISEEKKCATACLHMKNGVPDACDGDTTKCPLGSGLYCGGNYLSADPKTLYRCTSGAVTVEQACPTTCVREPDGTPDRCE